MLEAHPWISRSMRSKDQAFCLNERLKMPSPREERHQDATSLLRLTGADCDALPRKSRSSTIRTSSQPPWERLAISNTAGRT